MNVQKLIEELSKYPQDAMVIKSEYAGGKTEVTCTEQCNITLNVNVDDWFGPHEVRIDGDTMAVYIY